jgi:transcriptional regulator with XRE-family HTH domain
MSNTDAETTRIPPLHSPFEERSTVPRPRKPRPKNGAAIGERIRRARLARGLTQTELGKKVGVSQGMVTYYEVRGVSPAPTLLVRLARVLKVSVEELVGEKARATTADDAPESLQLWRRFKKVQALPPQDRKSVLKMIDALAEQAARRKAS